MILALGGRKIEVSRADLVLGLGAVPRLELLFKDIAPFEGEPAPRLSSSVVRETERASLEWQGSSLAIAPFGFQKRGGSGSAEARLHALLLEEDLEAWFETRIEAPPRLQYGVYQNPAEIGGWTFLATCLGHTFRVPDAAYVERIDAVLPIATCLLRPLGQDNLEFIGSVVDYLQQHIPELVGWCGMFGGVAQEPLRLVFLDEVQALQLDEGWELQSPRLPSRYAGHEVGRTARLSQSRMQIQSDMKMALLETLARHGIQEAVSGFLERGSEADLLYLPGPVKLGKRLMLCEQVTYSFDHPEDILGMTLELSTGFAMPSSASSAVRFEGCFDAWDAGDDARSRVFVTPADDSVWSMIDREDANLLDPKAGLMARFVTPTETRRGYAGLYVRHEKGDRVAFDVQPFRVPLIHGSWQILHEELEAATLSLNTELLALSTSDGDTAIDRAHGVVMDEKQIMHRAESDIIAEADTITLDQNVVVTETSLNVNSTTDIAKKTRIDGKLEVGGM